MNIDFMRFQRNIKFSNHVQSYSDPINHLNSTCRHELNITNFAQTIIKFYSWTGVKQTWVERRWFLKPTTLLRTQSCTRKQKAFEKIISIDLTKDDKEFDKKFVH